MISAQRFIDYEVWATTAWIEALPNFKDQRRAAKIITHILGCFSGWLPLISDWNHDVKLLVSEDPKTLHARLIEKVRESAEGDLERRVTFTGAGGVERSLTAGELIHHMLNHATYHRGHLRGLAEAEGLEDFPETDSVKFFVANA
ncbi:MAG: hypothetical protein MUC92_06070 [Fimbriimonadaceae bacterium]|jgi:uncharacterized damage-inducible protein DinB|nr:hypothetical protein [Fimbriimonadaceae bacterium]